MIYLTFRTQEVRNVRSTWAILTFKRIIRCPSSMANVKTNDSRSPYSPLNVTRVQVLVHAETRSCENGRICCPNRHVAIRPKSRGLRKCYDLIVRSSFPKRADSLTRWCHSSEPRTRLAPRSRATGNSSVVEPVEVVERRPFDVLDVAPGSLAVNEFVFVETVE